MIRSKIYEELMIVSATVLGHSIQHAYTNISLGSHKQTADAIDRKAPRRANERNGQNEAKKIIVKIAKDDAKE